MAKLGVLLSPVVASETKVSISYIQTEYFFFLVQTELRDAFVMTSLCEELKLLVAEKEIKLEITK
jgi:hypothetical protein